MAIRPFVHLRSLPVPFKSLLKIERVAAGAENPMVRSMRLGPMVLSVRLNVPCEPLRVLLVLAA